MQDVTENTSRLKRKCKLFVLQQNEKQSDRDLCVFVVCFGLLLLLKRELREKYSQHESEMLHSHKKSILVAVNIP